MEQGQALEQQLAVQLELAEIRRTLERICAEIDLAINALRTLLTIQGEQHKAAEIERRMQRLQDDREALRAEMYADIGKRDTEPPPAPEED